MKDANLKAIEELQGMVDILNCYKYDHVDRDDWYRVGFNHACDMILGVITRKLDRLEREVML